MASSVTSAVTEAALTEHRDVVLNVRTDNDPAIRVELSALSGWPTIPQVFVKGELIGGADIVEELYASGELKWKLENALGDAAHAGTVEVAVVA